VTGEELKAAIEGGQRLSDAMSGKKPTPIDQPVTEPTAVEVEPINGAKGEVLASTPEKKPRRSRRTTKDTEDEIEASLPPHKLGPVIHYEETKADDPTDDRVVH
jgi:hypothetical protein